METGREPEPGNGSAQYVTFRGYGIETAERFGVTRRTAELMLEAVNKAIYFGGDFEEQQEDAQKYFKLFLLPPSKNEPGGSMP